jgi:hypothetical protein
MTPERCIQYVTYIFCLVDEFSFQTHVVIEICHMRNTVFCEKTFVLENRHAEHCIKYVTYILKTTTHSNHCIKHVTYIFMITEHCVKLVTYICISSWLQNAAFSMWPISLWLQNHAEHCIKYVTYILKTTTHSNNIIWIQHNLNCNCI